MVHTEAAGIKRQDIVMDRYLHRLTVAYGMPLAERGGRAGRPAVAVPGRPGVFVAGDWVGAEGLLADASAASAAEAVAQAVSTVRTGSTVGAAKAANPAAQTNRHTALVRP